MTSIDKANDSSRNESDIAKHMRRLPRELVLRIFTTARQTQPAALLADIAHFYQSLFDMKELYETYWLSEPVVFSREESHLWLENDLVRFMNRDRPLMRGLVSGFYGFMRRHRSMRHCDSSAIENAFRYRNMQQRAERRRKCRKFVDTKLFFFWGALTAAERETFANTYGEAHRIPT